MLIGPNSYSIFDCGYFPSKRLFSVTIYLSQHFSEDVCTSDREIFFGSNFDISVFLAHYVFTTRITRIQFYLLLKVTTKGNTDYFYNYEPLKFDLGD